MLSKSMMACCLLLGASSKLVVYSPTELVDQFAEQNGVIPANYANFGHIPYGQSLIGTITFDPKNPTGCAKMDATEDTSNDPNETKKTKIIMVERGECSFVQKVRNAERAGASLVVVIDNKTEDIEKAVMGDDGTGTGIRVPSMLIGKEHGKKLKEFALSNNTGTLSAEFTMPNIEEKVHVELWYSSNNVLALDFLKEFDKYRHELADRIEFEPRFVTWACEYCTDDYKAEECFGDGKYCAPNHERSSYSNIYGRDIISEDLRQHCLHESLKAKGDEALWWDYIKFVH